MHVSNLSYKVTSEEEIKEAFEKEFGEVKKVSLPRELNDSRIKGFAFVEFIDEASMIKAL